MTRGFVVTLVVALALAGAVDRAGAETPIAARATIARGDRAALAAEVARARRRHPQVFAAVDAVLGDAAARDADRRGPLAILAPELAALGPDATWALADRLLSGHADEAQTATARLAVAVGLITAAGATADPRLRPLWTAILDGPEARSEVLRSAAEALARVDDDAAARALVARARGDGRAAPAVRAALGGCRHPTVATALAAALGARPAPDEARRLIRSLAELGAAWAWQTPTLRDRPERDAVREVVARAVLGTWLTGDAGTRQAAATALVVVDLPAVEGWIAGARRRASAADRTALDALAARLRRSRAGD